MDAEADIMLGRIDGAIACRSRDPEGVPTGIFSCIPPTRDLDPARPIT